jgi:hypothetical protein
VVHVRVHLADVIEVPAHPAHTMKHPQATISISQDSAPPGSTILCEPPRSCCAASYLCGTDFCASSSLSLLSSLCRLKRASNTYTRRGFFSLLQSGHLRCLSSPVERRSVDAPAAACKSRS